MRKASQLPSTPPSEVQWSEWHANEPMWSEGNLMWYSVSFLCNGCGLVISLPIPYWLTDILDSLGMLF